MLAILVSIGVLVSLIVHQGFVDADGACASAHDQNGIRKHKAQEETLVQGCASKHFGDKAGTEKCISDALEISPACADCYILSVTCGIEKCALQCANGPSPQCSACVKKNCVQLYDKCAGPTPKVIVLSDEFEPSFPAASGSCQSNGDQTAIRNHLKDQESLVQNCAASHLGNEGDTDACIVSALGVSQPCADCFYQTAACGLQHCALECLDPTSADCSACTKKNCLPKFFQCAGPVPTAHVSSPTDCIRRLCDMCLPPIDSTACNRCKSLRCRY